MTPCLLFSGRLNRDGYGIQSKHGQQNAHRVAWVEAFGEIPPGLHVLHECDNRACINPAHLRLGTNADNVADRQAKGRQARGERYGNARLTAEKVTAIFKRIGTELERDLAREFGVSVACISNISTGRTWGWLTGAQR